MTRSYQLANKKLQNHNESVYGLILIFFAFRLVVTTVTLEPDEDDKFSKMILEQNAEKDMPSCNDSTVTWEANGDFLTMSLEVFSPHDPNISVKAVRKFIRHRAGEKRIGARKLSAPF